MVYAALGMAIVIGISMVLVSMALLHKVKQHSAKVSINANARRVNRGYDEPSQHAR